MRFNRSHVLLFLILLLTLVIRIPGIDQALFGDEQDLVVGVYAHEAFGFNPIVSHAPLASWIFQAIGMLCQSIWCFRLFMAFLGTVTILLIFMIGKKVYNTRAGLAASLIASLSFYHVLASNQLADDGALALMFYSLFFYVYIHYRENPSNRLAVSLGIIFGLALITKETSIFMLAIVAIYESLELVRSSASITTWFSRIKMYVPVASIGALFVAGFLTLAYIANTTLLGKILQRSGGNIGVGVSFLGISMFLFWATPFLIGLFLIATLDRDRRNDLFIIWFAIIFVFYSFFVKQGDYSRYYMNLIIPMSLVAGNFLGRVKFRKIHLMFGSAIAAAYYILLTLLSRETFQYVPRDMNLYISKIQSLDFSFMFSYVSSSGPYVLLPFNTIVLTFVACASLFLLYIVVPKKVKTCLLVSFIAIAFTFNIFLLNQYLFALDTPDVSQTVTDSIEYYQGLESDAIVYSNNDALLFMLDANYLRKDGFYYVGNYGESLPKVTKGNILLLDYPTIPRDSELWIWAESCDLRERFSSEGQAFVYIYSC
ncbi:hypothetical protein HOD83_02440 [Candidatus Woesearchaeota archaeon]|jgi:hypothetical protein|nr:hypothetical protein [Candidatus Woesearchaeota archaeon]MBT4114132.1 hypothetical protein [Candidatus Woesearchaeota archaeon]MBT4248425.1 hypothetical protein [Candidatus Woesearchaeota archaeon]